MNRKFRYKLVKASFFIWLMMIWLPYQLVAQQTCTNDPRYSKLDFWLGEWNVFDEKGNLVGTNTIFKDLNDCIITEDWTDAQGGRGKSLFYIERNDSIWHQVWVTETATTAGGQKHKKLIAENPDGGLVFRGHYFFKGRRIEDRTTLTPKKDGTVEQLIERSTDQGGSWRKGFLGIYKRNTTAGDRQILNEMHRQYIEGWKNMDEEQVLSLFEKEAMLQPNRLKPIRGIENIRKFWFPDDGSVTKIHRFETDQIAIEIRDSLAIATYTSHLDWSYRKGESTMAKAQQGVNTVIYRKQTDGSWKIWRRMWTDIYSEDKQ